MRIHTNTIKIVDVYDATAAAGMHGVDAEVTEHGSRTHERAFEVKLTGTSNRRPNDGRYGGAVNDSDDYAATWDEWGMFLNALFEIDPAMRVGSAKHPTYANAAHFHAATGQRFDALTARNQHHSHRWAPLPGVTVCNGCSARRPHISADAFVGA